MCAVLCRFFFQQLIAGVHFCHKHGVSHRDLKLENTLLKHEVTQAGCAPIPVLKIADFGFCKHESLHTPPDSKVGTPAYISPVCAALPPLSPAATPLCTQSLHRRQDRLVATVHLPPPVAAAALRYHLPGFAVFQLS